MPSTLTAWEKVSEDEWNTEYNKAVKRRNTGEPRPYNQSSIVSKTSGDIIYPVWPKEFRIKYLEDPNGEHTWKTRKYKVEYFIREYTTFGTNRA